MKAVAKIMMVLSILTLSAGSALACEAARKNTTSVFTSKSSQLRADSAKAEAKKQNTSGQAETSEQKKP